MSTWNYRLVKIASDLGEEIVLHEVYYDDDGKPVARTKQPAEFVGASADEVRKALKRAIKATSQAVLDDAEIGGS